MGRNSQNSPSEQPPQEQPKTEENKNDTQPPADQSGDQQSPDNSSDSTDNKTEEPKQVVGDDFSGEGSEDKTPGGLTESEISQIITESPEIPSSAVAEEVAQELRGLGKSPTLDAIKGDKGDDEKSDDE